MNKLNWETSSPEDIGRFLREMMDEAGWSITKVEEILKVERSTVTRWISGNRKMPYASMTLLWVKYKNPEINLD